MTATTLTAESVVGLPPADVYRQFGKAEAGSWLFGALSESVRVGTAVRMALPIGPRAGRHEVELFGRFSAIRPHSAIVIEHTQPWRGRLKLSFGDLPRGRTRLRVRADVSETGLEWLVRHTGGVFPVPPVASDAVRIGVMTSKSGPGAIFSMATEYLAELAVEEVNDTGGIGGRRLELLVADDCTDPVVAESEVRRLARAGCRAIFACTTSASFTAMERAARTMNVLLVHTVMNEGGTRDRGAVVRFGERPLAQIETMSRPLMRATGARNWFLVGEDYSWSHDANAVARSVLPRAGGRVVGQAYAPLGTKDFGPLIERIERSGADVVMSSFVGLDEVEFQRQCASAGLRSSVRSLSLALDESTCEYIGDPASEGLWTALGYLQDGPAAGNPDLLARYRDAYGRWAPPISTHSETTYEAVLQYAQAVRDDPDGSASAHHRALMQHRTGRGGTAIGARDLLLPRLYLAEARSGVLNMVDEVG